MLFHRNAIASCRQETIDRYTDRVYTNGKVLQRWRGSGCKWNLRVTFAYLIYWRVSCNYNSPWCAASHCDDDSAIRISFVVNPLHGMQLSINRLRTLVPSEHNCRQCPVFAGMKKFEYEGRKWHEECFQCDECHQPIRDQKFAPENERVICVVCYEKAYAPRCHNCKGVSLFVYTSL